MEKAYESFINESFIKYQREAEERFQKYEEERWKKEMEVETKRRQGDREQDDADAVSEQLPTCSWAL